ncbi:DUF2218 domain-containing protein [Nocardia sp. NPDC049526]|uniref:DUF2218 domain-containing protein n=1 Tax=Nocardia sp. NPDC049526 TaxID=3364316 RepID=UPI0037B3F729
MPTIEARIPTDRPGRYIRQFAQHATAMGTPRGHRMRGHGGRVELRVESSNTNTTVVFEPWGRCVLRADADALVVRIDSPDDTALQRIRELVSRDLDRFGRHELIVCWQRVDEPDSSGAAQ